MADSRPVRVSPEGPVPAARIQDYALIGDCRSAALVSRDGSIDWLCWPRFDSPSLFAAALDATKGGRWRVSPVGPFSARRTYLGVSNVLLTTFETATGEVRLTDFMTVWSEPEKHATLVPEHELLRLIEGVRGEVELEILFEPRPDYARATVPLRQGGALGVRLEHKSTLTTLRADGPLELRGASAHARWTIRAGERKAMSLTFDSEGPAVLPPLGEHARDSEERTLRWWREWAARSSYRGRYREEVVRSLLTLKLLSFSPSGAIIAAPTTSLPERIGGDLNWDYRYCWLRDASLTVRAYLELGYEDEALAFVGWLLHTTRLTRPKLRILYDVYGERPGNEQLLPHLEGHFGSRPVRIRNAAAKQLQLDTYGEVIDAVAQLSRRGARFDREVQAMLRQFGQFVVRNWSKPDQGIWEPRDRPRQHTFSRVLCWTALDRLVELHQRGALGGSVDRFAEERDLIRASVERHAWNRTLHSYTQVLDGDTVDASVFLLGWYGFHRPDEARMRATWRRVAERLQVRPGLFFRYEESRGAGEGAFGICSFWAAEFLARGGGTLEEARRSFEATLHSANDVGLFSEEMDVETGAPLGNFPQAFTHVGLIGAALALEAREAAPAATIPVHRPAERRPEEVQR